MKDSALQRVRDWRAQTAVVLGSGLASLVPAAAAECVVRYDQAADLPQPGVAGHAGRFVCADVAGTKLIFAQGRVHLYERHSAELVTACVRFLAAAGVKTLILTNAAGSLNPEFTPGDWMMVADHLNLTGTTPLGPGEFVDMQNAYAPELRARFKNAAALAKIRIHEGVYAGLCGPQYETPAEVRMLRTLGADAVGMSTVLETIQARALGLQVAAFSCLTNWAAGVFPTNLSHSEVLKAGQKSAAGFWQILESFAAER